MHVPVVLATRWQHVWHLRRSWSDILVRVRFRRETYLNRGVRSPDRLGDDIMFPNRKVHSSFTSMQCLLLSGIAMGKNHTIAMNTGTPYAQEACKSSGLSSETSFSNGPPYRRAAVVLLRICIGLHDRKYFSCLSCVSTVHETSTRSASRISPTVCFLIHRRS